MNISRVKIDQILFDKLWGDPREVSLHRHEFKDLVFRADETIQFIEVKDEVETHCEITASVVGQPQHDLVRLFIHQCFPFVFGDIYSTTETLIWEFYIQSERKALRRAEKVAALSPDWVSVSEKKWHDGTSDWVLSVPAGDLLKQVEEIVYAEL